MSAHNESTGGARCWRSECRNACYYPDACSERRPYAEKDAVEGVAGDRFLPEGFEFDAEGRVTRPCPKCGGTTYAPGPSGWASRYWVHSETDAYACEPTS